MTSRLAYSEDLDNATLAYMNDVLGMLTCLSEDGKYIFFPDKIDDGISIYYREIAKPESETIKIDSDILSYTVNTSATMVTYLKGDEGNLYQYKLAEDTKDKIASEVVNFEVSDDGNQIAYINSEGSFYLKNADKDTEKIASEVSSIEYLSDDFKTVYYIKEGSLYKQVEGEDKEKLASDVYDVIKIYETGEIYYLSSEGSEISLMDYVIDDMQDTDASITEPTYPDILVYYPDYPSWGRFRDDEVYEAVCEEWTHAYDEYDAACNAYYAKLSRDELRAALAEATLEQSSYSLCFYNGAEATVVTDAFVGNDLYLDYTCASDAPVIIYEAYNQSNPEEVNLSEIESINDIEDMVKAALFSSAERYVAVKDAATVVEQEKKATNFVINSSGTAVYYIDNIPDEKDYGELYSISIAKGVVGKAEVYDSDVYAGYCSFVDDDKFVYYKDYKNDKGELYVNKTKIDYDVNAASALVYSDLDKVIYFTDWDDDKQYGTLKIYQNGESVRVADEAHACSAMDDGRILYLYDYSTNYCSGELHVWENDETRKIDDDVAGIVPIYETKYRGASYSF